MVFLEKKVHLQLSNREILYLKKEGLVRGLCNMKHKSEQILVELLNSSKNTSKK